MCRLHATFLFVLLALVLLAPTVRAADDAPEILQQTLDRLEERLPNFGDLASNPEVVAHYMEILERLEPLVLRLEGEQAGPLLERMEALRGKLSPTEAAPPPEMLALPAAVSAQDSFAQKVAPPNDDCENAQPIGLGIWPGDLSFATNDGSTFCGPSPDSINLRGDVWYRLSVPEDQSLLLEITSPGSLAEAQLSVHTGCPGTFFNQALCTQNVQLLEVRAGEEYFLRVAEEAFDPDDNRYQLRIAPGATISGQVLNSSGQALADCPIFLQPEGADSAVEETQTDAEGRYTLPVFEPGNHLVYTECELHQNQLYDDVSCGNAPCSLAPGGDFIPVGDGEQITGIHFRLAPYGTLSGTVTEADTGEPIPFALLETSPFQLFSRKTDRTDEEGRYEILVRPEARWVQAAQTGYRPELYQEIPCPDLLPCDVDLGTQVTVPLDGEAQDIDFTLERLGTISGQLLDQETGEPILVATVLLTKENGGEYSQYSDFGGHFAFGGLEAGTYFLSSELANAFFLYPDYIDEVYPDIPCPPEGCEPTSGTPLRIRSGETLSGLNLTLERAPRVSGQVRATTGEPIEDLTVLLTPPVGFPYDAITDADGRYSLPMPRFGTFFLNTEANRGVVHEAWEDHLCGPGNCDLDSADPIEGFSEDLDGIDFVLDRLSSLEGRLLDAQSGQQLSTIAIVSLRNSDGHLIYDIWTPNGTFFFPNLPKDTYHIHAWAEGYAEEYYGGLQCPISLPECGLGAGIPVELNQALDGFEIELDPLPLGTIEGTVKDKSGNPFENVLIELYDDDGDRLASKRADSTGAYSFQFLEPGIYYAAIETSANSAIRGQVFNGVPCPFSGSCAPLTGSPIQVLANSTASGIDFELDRLGRIQGTISESVLGGAVPNALVRIYNSNGLLVDLTAGAPYVYESDGLIPDDYHVTISSNEGFFNQIHPGIPCSTQCDLRDGAPVTVDLDSVVTVDFALEPQQGILGRVTEAGTDIPISGARISAWDENGEQFASVFAQEDGRYLLPLPIRNFHLSAERTTASGVFHGAYYPGVPCAEFTCTPFFPFEDLPGTAILPQGDTLLEGFNFELAGDGCVPSETNHCLLNDRFLTRLWFDTPEGPEELRPARTADLTNDTGAFYFFGPDNLEVVVKVIDACAPPFDRFWVFAAGLTNLETRLEVLDLVTLEERVYETTGGEPFQLIRDTRAFETCDAGEGLAAPVETENKLRSLVQQVQEFEASVNLSEEEETTKIPGFCLSNETRLCLVNERFEVEVFWSHDGDGGVARAVQLTDETGYFWFFREDNVEVVTKIIDACTLDDFNNFWVFAAGLTDVETIVWVRDTITGESRQYVNPSGTPFAPIQDTRAFDTCP